MRRVGLCIAAMAAVIVVACGEGDAVQSPTGPSASAPSASAPSAPSAPQGGCIAAPANLVVVSVVGSTVSLSWSPVSGATEYLVLVGSSPSSSNILSTNTSNANYAWGGVPPGHHYARVQAKASCGTSSSSNEVDFSV